MESKSRSSAVRGFIFSLWGFGLLLVTLTAFGQGDRGTISGDVKDPVGGIVASALVQTTNAATGAVFKSTSSKDGAYALADLPAGSYDISLTLAGVAPFELKNVAVSAGKTIRVDINLKEG